MDIISRRNNLIDFFIRKEKAVEQEDLDDIGNNKKNDIFLYIYLKGLENNGIILKKKQKDALYKLNTLYKYDEIKNPFLSDYYFNFNKTIKNAKDILKNTSATDDDSIIINKLEKIYKKLYLIYDVNSKETKETKKINKNIREKVKGGGNISSSYEKFVSPRIKNNDTDTDTNDVLDSIKDTILINDQIDDNIAEKNVKFGILLNNLIFDEGNSSDISANNDAAVATVAAVAASQYGGDDNDTKKNIKEIIELLEENYKNINTLFNNAEEFMKKINLKIEYKPTERDDIEDYFNEYDKNIDIIKYNKEKLEEYLNNINTLYNNTKELIKNIDNNLLKNNIIVKLIKEFNKISLKNNIINYYINEIDKIINEYPKNKNINDRKLEKLEKDKIYLQELEKKKAEAFVSASQRRSANNSSIYKTASINYKNIIEKTNKSINNANNAINTSKKIITKNKEELKEVEEIKNKVKDIKSKVESKVKELEEVNSKVKELEEVNSKVKEVEEVELELEKKVKELDDIVKELDDIVKELDDIVKEFSKPKSDEEYKKNKENIKEDDIANILLKKLENIISILKKQYSYNTISDNNIDNIDNNINEKSVFEKILTQYNNNINDIKLGINNDMTTMEAEDNLYDQINISNLNPIEVLKLNSNDKYIFCTLIFFIRLFIIIVINLLIDHDIIKRLDTALISYIILYILIIIIITVVVNLDSYKLRILLNYFNTNININKLLIHIFIVLIFFILILIIEFNKQKEDDKYRTKFTSIYDFTYIYTVLIDFFSKKNVDNYIIEEKISDGEKLKLQYKFEILTIIVYMFSCLIVLIM